MHLSPTDTNRRGGRIARDTYIDCPLKPIKTKVHILLLVLICIVACTPLEEQPAQILRCADMPAPRTSAIAWSVGNKGYVFGGRGEDNAICNDMYIYDSQSDTWTNAIETPLQARVNGCACVAGGKAYIGLGFCGHAYGDDACLNDWWEYTPATDTWRRLADFPSENTVGAVAYTDGTHIYCVHGFGWGFTTDVLCYDIAADTWTAVSRPGYPEHASMAGAGATLQGRHYFGTGYNTHSLCEWYEIDFQGDWTKRKNVPSKRENAVCAVSEQYIYLAGGQHFGGTLTDGQVFDDILRYAPETDSWALAGHTPEAAINRIGFTVNGIAYIGLGEDSQGNVLKTLYRIED